MKSVFRGLSAGLALAVAAGIGPGAPVAAAGQPSIIWLDSHGSLSDGGAAHGVVPHGYSASRLSPGIPEAQATGLVLIDTTIDFGDGGVAAGTGMVIRREGIVLTNHHVVAGSTKISVTIATTGRAFDADVLGYDTQNDVAVLRLPGAGNLATVTTDTQPVVPGVSITSVGNARGGGRLVAATGQVTATGVSIQVSDQDGSNQATLDNLIKVNAKLVPGDSGGAMFSGANAVIGMNVAGSSDPAARQGYALPITTVLSSARAILAGQASATITIGRPGALGIVATATPGGVQVVSVVKGQGAERAGITVGSTITSIGGTAVTSIAQLTTALSAYKAGDQVIVAWTDPTGQARSATITLGPAPLP